MTEPTATGTVRFFTHGDVVSFDSHANMRFLVGDVQRKADGENGETYTVFVPGYGKFEVPYGDLKRHPQVGSR